MKYAETDHRRASRISRLVFTAGLFVLVPGTGMTLQTRLLANDEGAPSLSTASTDAQPSDEKLLGKWKITHCEFSGRNEPQMVGIQDEFRGNKWLRPNRRTAEYRLKLDSTKKPMWVDLSADRLGDRTLKGIYSLEGDKLTICYAYDPELPRPTEFKTTPDARRYIYVLERVKKDKTASVRSDPGPSILTDSTVAQSEKMQGKWKIAHCEFSGQKEPQMGGIVDGIIGNSWLRPHRTTGEYRFKFDSTKDPMWVDLSADRLGDRTLKGIYSLEGDKLTICYAYDPELPRPTEFKTMPDVRAYMYVLERVKK